MSAVFARWIIVSVALLYYRRAQREIDRSHPDAGPLAIHVTALAHEQRALLVALRQWRHTSPTLSAVKVWL